MSATPSAGKSTRVAGNPATPADFEVLPPEGSRSHPGQHPKEKALAWMIQYVMDNLLRIPGTNARVGITPLLELLPVFGDGAAVVISAITIIEGARRRVPKIVLARMGMNVLLNGLIGTIPAVGEAFSIWFKPSYRNYLLLQKHGSATGVPGAAQPGATTRDWLFVAGLIAGLFIIVGLFIGAGFYISYALLNSVFHWR